MRKPAPVETRKALGALDHAKSLSATRTRGVYIAVTDDELRCIADAATDAHMSIEEYTRCMTLCASGRGDALVHIERAREAGDIAYGTAHAREQR